MAASNKLHEKRTVNPEQLERPWPSHDISFYSPCRGVLSSQNQCTKLQPLVPKVIAAPELQYCCRQLECAFDVSKFGVRKSLNVDILTAMRRLCADGMKFLWRQYVMVYE